MTPHHLKIGEHITEAEAARLSERTGDNELCPVCGYLCLGKGGLGCIDKPKLARYTHTDAVIPFDVLEECPRDTPEAICIDDNCPHCQGWGRKPPERGDVIAITVRPFEGVKMEHCTYETKRPNPDGKGGIRRKGRYLHSRTLERTIAEPLGPDLEKLVWKVRLNQ